MAPMGMALDDGYLDHYIRLRRLSSGKRFLRASDLEKYGIPRIYLTRMVRYKELTRIARGLYERTDAPSLRDHDLAVACALRPDGVVCLYSALHWHGLLPEKPEETWLTQRPGTPKPKRPDPGVQLVYMRPVLLEGTVTKFDAGGAEIRVTNLEKTVVDTFRYRRHVEIELALEVLDAYLRRADDLYRLLDVAAKHRMRSVILGNLDWFERGRSGPKVPQVRSPTPRVSVQ